MYRTLVTTFLCLVLSSPADAANLSGPVRVIDGDTFQFIGGPKIRIFGIDTLEKRQKCMTRAGTCAPCGEETKQKAIEIIGKSSLNCELSGKKSYDREVASCSLPNGADYGLTMIQHGWALAYQSFLPKNGKGHPYVEAEEEAKSSAVGIWRTRFISPSDWRNHKMRLQCEK